MFLDYARLETKACPAQTNAEMTTAVEIVWPLVRIHIPVGVHHDEKDHDKGTSCKPCSASRDLEILRRENRGTDLKDYNKVQTVASIHVQPNCNQEDS